MLEALHNQGKQITLCKVLAHMGIKGNEEADKSSKTSNKYDRDHHNKTTLYKLQSDY